MAMGNSMIAARMEPQKLGEYFGGKVCPPKQDAPEWGSWVAKHEETGWSIINTSDVEFADRFVKEHRASFKGVFLAYQVLDDTNESRVAFYKDGECLWSVAHDGSSGDKYHLVTEGTPPEELAEIAQNLREKLDETGSDHPMDWGVEIPIELADSIIGMRHDVELCEPEVLAYYQLIRDDKVVDLDDCELELPDRPKGLNILDLMSIFSKR